MIRNVLVSSAIAWFPTFWYTRGMLTEPPSQQDHATYLTAVAVWAFIFHCVLNITVQSGRLMRNRFLAHSFLFYVRRIMRGTYATMLATVALAAGVANTCGHLPINLRPLKIDFYVLTTFSQYFFVVTEVVTPSIYQHETVHGNEKRLAHVDSTSPTGKSRARSVRRTLRVSLQSLSSLVSICFATGYVHLVSQPTFHTNTQVLWFIISSMLLKLADQEIAKHSVMNLGAIDLCNMCIVVGVPTVFVNTQVRIVIMSMDSSQSTLFCTWLMAIIEVVLRLGKVLILRWQIRSRANACEIITKRDDTTPGTCRCRAHAGHHGCRP